MIMMIFHFQHFLQTEYSSMTTVHDANTIMSTITRVLLVLHTKATFFGSNGLII